MVNLTRPWGSQIFGQHYYFFFFFAVLGLCCGTQAFSSGSESGLHSNCSWWVSPGSGFSCYRAWALCVQASAVAVRRICCFSPRALKCGLSSCGTWAQLLWSMWDLPRPGIKPVSPELPGGFLTTGPPEKSTNIIVGVTVRVFWNKIDI